MHIHSSSTQQPWYKHRWPWILISGPLIAMLACMITIYLAYQKQDILLVDGVKKTGLKIVEMPTQPKPLSSIQEMPSKEKK